MSSNGNMIVAHDSSYGIGRDWLIPWHYSEDLKFFKSKTLGQNVYMGKITYLSLPVPKLPGRMKYVLTSSDRLIDEEDLKYINQLPETMTESDWVIGGSSLYNAVEHLVSDIYVTVIDGNYSCNVFVNPWWENSDKYRLESSRSHDRLLFNHYKRK